MNRITLQQAEALASAEIRAGYAISYCTSYANDTGCVIHLQTDQGWNPEPFWQQREVEPRPGGSNDSLAY